MNINHNNEEIALNNNNLEYNSNNSKLVSNTNNSIQNNSSNNEVNNNNINKFGFNSLINNILILLKDYFHNDNLYLNNIKLISESINEQTLFARCSINDIMLYLNQITYPRYNGSTPNMNEKYIKDKLNIINDRLGKIDDLKDSMNQNIRNTEIELITYYEESRNILHKIRILHKDGNSNDINIEKNCLNFEGIEILEKKYNKLLNENSRLKMNIKINNSLKSKSVKRDKNRKNNFMSNNNRNNSCSRNKYNYNLKNSNSMKDEVKNIGYKKKSNTLILSKNSEDLNKNKKYYINIIIDFSTMILDFLNDMKNLQEHIIKKSSNLKEFKKKFEINKKNIKLFCEKILKNRNSPEKIKDINIKTKQNEKNNIHKLEKEIKEKDIKIKKLEEEISKYISKNKELMNKINERDKNKTNGNEEIKKELGSIDDKNLNQTNINNNKNEILIKEKNRIIDELNNKLKEKEIDYKICFDIKTTLEKINEDSTNKIKELIDKDKQFELYEKKENSNGKDEDEYKIIMNNLKEYQGLTQQLKDCNNILQQINN